ncbi:threonine-type endopeptidase [Aureococcus anophagefferens]|nr:threonine-type endopeptidase [Aureococcus anophagefferens]
MFMAKSEYDRGVNTFSPEGRLFQVEYAIQAVKLGSTSIGIKTADGVVLAVEKRVTSTLMESSSIEKVMEIDSHCGAAMSGLIADARTLVDHARVEAQNHRFTYDEPMPTTALTQSVCDLALSARTARSAGGGSKMSRPFGVALLVAGYDDDGAQLYYADPSGTFTQYKAKAMGSGARARSNLQESYSESMSFADAEVLALSTLKQVMEDKLTTDNVDVASVTKGGFRATEAEITAVVARIAA